MPRLPEHLQRLDGAYKFRMRVPAALQPIIGKREFRRSFGQVDLVEAKRRLVSARLEALAEIDKARRSLYPQAATPHKAAELQQRFDEADLWSLMSAWFVEKRKEDVATSVNTDRAELLLQDISHLEDPRDASNSENFVRQTTMLFLEKQRVSIAEESPEFRQLSRMIRDALVERNKRRVQETLGHVGLELDPRFRALEASTILNPGANPTLSALISRYKSDKAKEKVNEQTKRKQDARLSLIQEMLGASIRVRSIDRAKARQLCEEISRLPPNLHKRFKGKSVSEVLEMSDEVLGSPMRAITANDYMSAFWALMQFALNEQLIDRNPANNLRVAFDKVDARIRRKPFSGEDLQRIFNAPIYRGCMDDQASYAVVGSARPKRARYWVALISLFSGMRQNEICPLLASDVKNIGPYPMFQVAWDDESEGELPSDGVLKSVKTEAGLRIVPVHPQLIRLGFMDYVESVKTTSPRGRLFPDLTLSKSGSYSANYSKWFAHFLDQVGITDKKKNFHSFRHTFRDAIRLTDMPPERRNAICGWRNAGAEDVYGKAKEVIAETLTAEIGKVSYRTLNLDHLLPNSVA